MSCGTVFGDFPNDGTTKKCLRTGKTISSTCFDLNTKSNKPFCYCVVCRPKSKRNEANFLASENGKKMRKRQNARESIKEMKRVYRQSVKGQEAAKEYHKTATFLEKCREYAKSQPGKESRKRSYDNNKLSQKLMNGLNRILHGGDSPSSLYYMSFSSSDELRFHFEEQLENGITMSDYGTKWTVDHCIPRSSYNHEDMEDVRRCWSASNMHPMEATLNKEKWNKIIPEYVAIVPVDMRPKGFDS